MYRDFSESSKNKLLGLVSDVEKEKWCDFTDWVGDRWLDFESWIGSLNIKSYVNNVNAYHKKVIDKNNATKKSIEEIFSKVASVDRTYEGILQNIASSLSQWKNYIKQLSEITSPANGNFNAQHMSDKLKNLLVEIDAQNVKCLRDQMVQDIDGELIFNEELMYEYIKKSPAEMSDAEQALLLELIAKLKDTVATYETLATLGNDEIGADILTQVSWVTDTEKYECFSAISAHYNEIYVNLLNYMVEQSEDSNTFAASFATIGLGNSVLTVLGAETYENLKDIFGKDSLKIYAAKYTSEHSEEYFLKLEQIEGLSFKSSGDFDKINNRFKDLKERQDEWLKENDHFKEHKDTKYYDKNGNEIDEKDAPDFYKRNVTLGEIKFDKRASVSLYDGTFDTLLSGTATVTIGEAEAHGNFAAGCYIIGKNGEHLFSPGVSAKVGVSVTGFNATYENQLLGDEMLGANVDGSVSALSASANAEMNVNFMGKDEKGNVVFDPQVNVGVNAEAVLVEAEGSVGVNVLGGEVGVSGGVKVGVGAHADVGYKDGVFKCDIGASLGIGFDVGIEVDVGGMVNTVADAASSAWDGLKKGWNSLWG